MYRLLTALVCVSIPAMAQSATAIAADYYTRLIQQGVVSGAAFAEVDQGEIAGTAVFGTAQQDSLWRAASTSKAFTAIGIMRLVEQGRLNLDVDINRYLKSFHVPATKQHPITIRHLLTHSSGLDDPFVGSAFLASAGRDAPLSTVMRNWMPARLFEPGEVQLYSNFGYGLLGAIIEEVTGRHFEDFMLTEVLLPLGMRNSTFQQPLSPELQIRTVPALERTVFGFTHPSEILYHRSSPGGGLTTTLGDLLRFVRFVQQGGTVDGNTLLRSTTLMAMLGDQANATGDRESYGFSVGFNKGQRYWYSGGDLGGYHTVLLWFPEHRRALVTMATSPSNLATWNLVPKVMESWFGAEKPAPATSPIAALPNARESAVRVSGIYRPIRYPHFDLGKTFVLSMDEVVRANADGSVSYGGERWVAEKPLQFRDTTGNRVLSFQEDSNRRIRFMNRTSERLHWYETGHAAIAIYFGFIGYSIAILWINRRKEGTRLLRATSLAILVHSLSWLAAVLTADPQRLILGLPWYLEAALAVGAAVPLLWICLAVSTTLCISRKLWPVSLAVMRLGTTFLLALYIPFICYWNLTPWPSITFHS